MLRLCSNDSSVLYRGVTPRRRARGPCGLSLLPPSCGSVGATGVSEVSRFSCMKFLDVPWGLRPRRTDRELALTFPSVLPSAHINRVGVWVVCFRGSMSHPAYPLSTLRWFPHGSSARLEAKWIAVGSEEARSRASLRPPLKLPVHISRRQLSRRFKVSEMPVKELTGRD
jgi:hypothetical protein